MLVVFAAVVLKMDGMEVFPQCGQFLIRIRTPHIAVAGIPAGADEGVIGIRDEVVHILGGHEEIIGAHVPFCAVFDAHTDVPLFHFRIERLQEGEVIGEILFFVVRVSAPGAVRRMHHDIGDSQSAAGFNGASGGQNTGFMVGGVARVMVGVIVRGMGLHERKSQSSGGFSGIVHLFQPGIGQKGGAGSVGTVEAVVQPAETGTFVHPHRIGRGIDIGVHFPDGCCNSHGYSPCIPRGRSFCRRFTGIPAILSSVSVSPAFPAGTPHFWLRTGKRPDRRRGRPVPRRSTVLYRRQRESRPSPARRRPQA